VVPNTSATAVNATGSAAALQSSFFLPGSILLGMLIQSTTPAQAVANNQYFQFTVTPETGFELDLSSLTFDATSNTPPSGWVLRSSLDGFATDLATADVPTSFPTLTPVSIDLTGAAFQAISSAVSQRSWPPLLRAGSYRGMGTHE
jgi:hypothetical protein